MGIPAPGRRSRCGHHSSADPTSRSKDRVAEGAAHLRSQGHLMLGQNGGRGTRRRQLSQLWPTGSPVRKRRESVLSGRRPQPGRGQRAPHPPHSSSKSGLRGFRWWQKQLLPLQKEPVSLEIEKRPLVIAGGGCGSPVTLHLGSRGSQGSCTSFPETRFARRSLVGGGSCRRRRDLGFRSSEDTPSQRLALNSVTLPYFLATEQ